MYELSIAAKYLIPKWRQLSVSIISMVSLLVIAAVVWLIVVFFSVTNGLTTSWVDKLTALTAPIRITPTPHYYKSYYYLIDSISSSSDYNLKTIGEKLSSPSSDPYDPYSDEEIPRMWSQPDRLDDGTLIDPVQTAFTIINQLEDVPGLHASDFEMTAGQLRLKLIRLHQSPYSLASEQGQNFVSHSSYIGSLDPQNPRLLHAILTPSMGDLSNLLNALPIKVENEKEDQLSLLQLESQEKVQQRLKSFFSFVKVKQLASPVGGWRIPRDLLPSHALWDITLAKRHEQVQRIIISKDAKDSISSPSKIFTYEKAKLSIEGNDLFLIANGKKSLLPPYVHLYLAEGSGMEAKLVESSLDSAKDSSSVKFLVNFKIQGSPLSGEVSYGNLHIGEAKLDSLFAESPAFSPFWMYALQPSKDVPAQLNLPNIEDFGEGILLPKSFHASGVLLGDTGFLSYYAPTVSAIQEQHVPVFVAGFYDPGIIPIGGKFIIASKELTSLIRSFYNQEEVPFSNGINVRFHQLEDAEKVKKKLTEAFEEANILPYWKIETYREFEFTKDIIQQLQSEKRLYTLLATLIIIVACSNIISMLIILVNDKKLEIGILRSMGATSFSIAIIFGTCGIVMGTVGSLLGTFAAYITLKNIQPLVDFIGRLQGYEMFNPLFYGESLPSEISMEALTFVVITTAVISLIAGMVPAIKASLLKPSAILKAE